MARFGRLVDGFRQVGQYDEAIMSRGQVKLTLELEVRMQLHELHCEFVLLSDSPRERERRGNGPSTSRNTISV